MIFSPTGISDIIFEVQEDNIKNKITGFQYLLEGWHYGEGVPPTPDTISSTIAINDTAKSFNLQTDAIPGVDGEIEISCFSNGDTLEFTIMNDKTLTFVHEKDGCDVECKENLSLDEAMKELINYSKTLCNMSDSYIPTTITPIKIDLGVLRSVIPPMAAEFQLFPCHV
jgi:hypothetical protein